MRGLRQGDLHILLISDHSQRFRITSKTCSPSLTDPWDFLKQTLKNGGTFQNTYFRLLHDLELEEKTFYQDYSKLAAIL